MIAHFLPQHKAIFKNPLYPKLPHSQCCHPAAASLGSNFGIGISQGLQKLFMPTLLHGVPDATSRPVYMGYRSLYRCVNIYIYIYIYINRNLCIYQSICLSISEVGDFDFAHPLL